MKLADIKSSKPVAICDRSALLCFANLASTEIPSNNAATFAPG